MKFQNKKEYIKMHLWQGKKIIYYNLKQLWKFSLKNWGKILPLLLWGMFIVISGSFFILNDIFFLGVFASSVAVKRKKEIYKRPTSGQ